MIYLDNAATTYPKPLCVNRAVSQALMQYGANPGRGGHEMSMASSREVFRCRETAATLFHLDNPAGVVFTLNCTMAMNIALKSILAEGGRVIVSDLEHNAVIRPLHAVSGRYPVYDVARVEEDDDQTVENFRRLITPSTRAIVCMHASNVFGTVLPVKRLGQLAHDNGLLFIVDAAQTAGVLPIDMQAMQIDMLCVAGHKGVYGPMGTGMLLCANGVVPKALIEGGTGSNSLSPEQPDELPERLESGTVNVPGICGLRAGMDFVGIRGGPNTIGQEELYHLAWFYDRVANMPEVTLYTPRPAFGRSAPLLSLNLRGQASEEVAAALNSYGVAVRAGLHCAPAAHHHFGTAPSGTVRFAPSVFTNRTHWEHVCKILLNMTRKNVAIIR